MTGRLVRCGVGTGTLTRGFPLTETTDADGSGGAALRARLRHDGYLFLRGLLPRADVLAARAAITARAPVDSDACSSLLERQDIAGLPAVKRVLESPLAADLLARATGLGGARPGDAYAPVAFKWLRAVRPGSPRRRAFLSLCESLRLSYCAGGSYGGLHERLVYKVTFLRSARGSAPACTSTACAVGRGRASLSTDLGACAPQTG